MCCEKVKKFVNNLQISVQNCKTKKREETLKRLQEKLKFNMIYHMSVAKINWYY